MSASNDLNALEMLVQTLLRSSLPQSSACGRFLRLHEYILDADRRVIPVANPLLWMLWMDTHRAERIVGRSTLRDGTEVMTDFLGLDHNPFGAEPHLFETMLRKPHGWDSFCIRYSTWQRAVTGHRALAKYFDAATPERGEDVAALDFPRLSVSTESFRSDYVTTSEDRTWYITGCTRIDAQATGSDAASTDRQAHAAGDQTDAYRSN